MAFPEKFQQPVIATGSELMGGLGGLAGFFSTAEATNTLAYQLHPLSGQRGPAPPRTNVNWLKDRVDEICYCWK